MPAVCRYGAEDHGAAVAGGIKRAQRETNFDDDAGAKGKVPAEPLGKRVSPAVACPSDAKPIPLPAPLEAPWTKTGLNLAGRGCLVYTASWNRSVKTEIPV